LLMLRICRIGWSATRRPFPVMYDEGWLLPRRGRRQPPGVR
jgi:hypothetical protein